MAYPTAQAQDKTKKPAVPSKTKKPVVAKKGKKVVTKKAKTPTPPPSRNQVINAIADKAKKA